VIDSLQVMEKDKFEQLGRSWSTTLTDGSSVMLKIDEKGNPMELKYEDRKEYCDMVRKTRLTDGEEQVN